MPRRNLLILFLVALVTVLCRQRVPEHYPRVLGSAMNTIENNALDPVGEQRLFEGAMYGMLSEFDENTTYLPPKHLTALNEALDLQFGGIGVAVTIDAKTKELVVGYPVANSPASRAGIVVGDKILRIDKTSTHGMSLQDASLLLRGKPHTTVTLSVLHPGAAKAVEIPLIREDVQEQSVLGDTCNPDGSWNYLLAGHDRIGYLRVSCFSDQTADELRKAIRWLKAHGMRGLVLDLRDDPGGYLPAAVAVCNLFIKNGEIVTTRGRGGVICNSYRADGDAPFADIPIAVLVNQDTASAAEIVAACLQDHHRAAIVGQRSYGKGTVQDLIPLEPGCGGMKLTTKSYWRPSGKDIRRLPGASAKQEWGVSPDEGCKLALNQREFRRWQAWRNARDLHQPVPDQSDEKDAKPFVDRQLERAVECVEKEATQLKTPKT
ncbi:MAG: S41 family peptidase [Thermoguttaceae bacterium]|jgi:carboxyl-terminal processing protease